MNDLAQRLREIDKPLLSQGPFYLVRKTAIEAADHIEAQEKLIEEMREALELFVSEYTDMVNSGDCGFWDPEKEEKVIKARTALSKSNPNTPERNDK